MMTIKTGTLIDLNEFQNFLNSNSTGVSSLEEIFNEKIMKTIFSYLDDEQKELILSFMKKNQLIIEKFESENPSIFLGLQSKFNSKIYLKTRKNITEKMLNMINKDWAQNVKIIYQCA